MVELSRRAELQLDALTAFYEAKARPEAIQRLQQSVRVVLGRIGSTPNAGLMASRPYPMLAKAGRRWIKQGRYWFAYSLAEPPLVLAVFYDAADIPGRL